MDEMIIQSDASELTPDVVAQLLRSGWSSSELADAAREGARYSPSCDSLLFPAVIGE